MAVEATAPRQGLDVGRPETIVDLWRRAAARAPEATAFLADRGRDGWEEVSWSDAARRVDELAAGFHALGIRRGDFVAILSNTRLEWTLSDYALLSLGAVVVPIYQTSSREDCEHVLTDSGAVACICEDRTQLEKVTAAGLDDLRLLVTIDGEADGATTLVTVAERGREQLASDPAVLEEPRAAVRADDPATCIYTSGTTGPPKGCIQTHRNWCVLVAAIEQIDGLMRPGDTAVLFLPLAHNFARLVQFASAHIGFGLALVPDVKRVARALVEIRPTIFPSVPRLFERIYSTVERRLRQESGVRGVLVRWALGVGGRASRRRAKGRSPGPLLALQLRAANRLVFGKIQERFGGRLRHAVSGGAPLAPEIIEFFDACGVPILEGYGLTETTSACAVNPPGRSRAGTVGPAVPGVEIALADDGEIRVRGETIFRGYHRNPEATAEILIDDGWLLTGDIGTIDADGYVSIVDRKKELIVTSGGKKISPYNLESALTASPYVAQALVVGDRRAFLGALVVPDAQELGRTAADEAETRKVIQQVVDEANATRGPVEQIRRFALLPREFTIDEGELTPTLKLRRKVVEAHFRDDIERLYDGGRTEAGADEPAADR
jgi:long-chain acyl-CoA synthetase